MLVVDTNRQSLDRVVPDQKIKKLMEFFDGAGWHVVEAKYGRLLAAAFEQPGGDALRHRIDEMSNEEYQSLFAHRGADLRERFLAGADAKVVDVLADISDDDLAPLVQNLGGHDLDVLLDAYRACDAEADRPSVVFAYTVKGWGLPIAGDPLNHSALLSATQIDELRASLGLTAETEWDRFDPESPEGRMCATTGGELNNVPVPLRPVLPIPDATGVPAAGATSTQESFGRILTRLGDVEGVAERIVTTSPDVSVSTNLGGWINKVGVFTPAEATDYLGEDRLLRWRQSPERPAHRARHQRDEPVPAAAGTRLRPRPARRAPPADRHGLRPVRLPRARRARSTPSTPARASSSSARPPASRSPRRAAPISRPSPRRSAWSCRA